VLLMDAKTRGTPRRATPDDAQLTSDAIERRRKEGRPIEPPYGGIGLGELDWPDPQIAFDALHEACDPDTETNPYWIEVSRAGTLEKWCAWVEHVSEKNWVGKSDLVRMIRFWFRNRGLDMPDA
jgi:hypothetical protein